MKQIVTEIVTDYLKTFGLGLMIVLIGIFVAVVATVSGFGFLLLKGIFIGFWCLFLIGVGIAVVFFVGLMAQTVYEMVTDR